jgi:hypothetical protein
VELLVYEELLRDLFAELPLDWDEGYNQCRWCMQPLVKQGIQDESDHKADCLYIRTQRYALAIGGAR